MTINQYTTIIVKLLKETKMQEGSSQLTIWDACVNHQKLNGTKFDENHIQLINSVFLENINSLKDEDVVEIWSSTDFAGYYESGFFDEAPKYDGDMISDISEEIIPLVHIDIDTELFFMK